MSYKENAPWPEIFSYTKADSSGISFPDMNATAHITAQLAAALEPTRSFIVERVKASQITRVKLSYEKLASAEWDLRKAFPINYNGWNCKAEKEAAAFAKSYTKIPNGWVSNCRPNSPEPRVAFSEKEIEKRAEAFAVKYAADVLNSYAGKLAAKAEKFTEGAEVKSIEYKGGGDPWGHSFVTVNLANGNKFTMKTQIILNVSCLGTLFNQFPTRLMK
jgi:hypothetical protein